MGEDGGQVGELLRDWRQRRKLSQLDLALETEISQRHLSFIESGRAQPSRDMVLRLAETLDVPLRERNLLLMAGGFAPVYPERSLDDPALAPARAVVDLILKGHEPYPALAIDRRWTLVAANGAVTPLLADVHPDLLKPPVNVLRLSLAPQGLAPRIINYMEWRTHLLERVRRQVLMTSDIASIRLLRELSEMPVPDEAARNEVANPSADYAGLAIPLRLRTTRGVLSFLSTTTVFGTPLDITLSELMLEQFFPADRETSTALHD
jgi:transcriptional regulator with XRE-family HTH domain